MAQIKFDATRMQEILNRLDEIKEQLQTSGKNSIQSLSTISSNIIGQTVTNVLKNYYENNATVLTGVENGIHSLENYLRGKIGTYTSTEQTASEQLTEVQNLLSGLQ